MSAVKKKTGSRKIIPVTLPKEHLKPCATFSTTKIQPKSQQQTQRVSKKNTEENAVNTNKKTSISTSHKKASIDLTSKWPIYKKFKNEDSLRSTTVSTAAKNKPKELATILSPKNYKVKPIIPAKRKELVSVAKAMHHEEFGTRLQNLFAPETNAALHAIQNGIYIGWRCPEYKWDCIRINKHSRCFCDHSLSEHAPYDGNSISLRCLVSGCCCKVYSFIPERPEDIGEWWLQKRPGFNIRTWRAKCRCKHTHTEHHPNTRKCIIRGCTCFIFYSNFLCAACDRHWEQHETFFESTNERQHRGLPSGQEYLPFYEMPDMRNIALTGQEDNNEIYNNLVSGSSAVPGHYPTKLALELNRNSTRER